jgi:hypothetical protein
MKNNLLGSICFALMLIALRGISEAADGHSPATYENPQQYASGVPYVFVNGSVVIDNGRHTGARPGKAIYGPGKNGGNQQGKVKRGVL